MELSPNSRGIRSASGPGRGSVKPQQSAVQSCEIFHLLVKTRLNYFIKLVLTTVLLSVTLYADLRPPTLHLP